MPRESPQKTPPPDRRRAPRVRPGLLRARLHRLCEGTLLDVSERGALVQLPAPQRPGHRVTLQIDLEAGEVLAIPARVVRSAPQQVQLEGAVLSRAEHHVGLEFVDAPPEAVSALARLVRLHLKDPT